MTLRHCEDAFSTGLGGVMSAQGGHTWCITPQSLGALFGVEMFSYGPGNFWVRSFFLGCAPDLGQIARKIRRFGAVLTKLWPCGLRAGGVDGLMWFSLLPLWFLHFLVAEVVLSTQNQTDPETTRYAPRYSNCNMHVPHAWLHNASPTCNA